MRSLLSLLVWLLIVFVAAFVGSQFMPDAWYQQLQKPSWNPPNWVFAPVWTTLYGMMAFAAWLVWKNGAAENRNLALTLFLVQLAVNAAWSWLFFGLHRPDLALVDIVFLWLLILATAVTFWRISAWAGYLLIPYLLWVSFATVLNFTIWQLNV